MPTFDTPEPVTATVELPIGELHVVASDRTDTTVEVHSSAEDRSIAEQFRIEHTGDDLRVTGPALGLLAKLTPRTPGRSLEVVIGLPAGSALTARSGYGDVRAEGRLGACTVHAKYGDVRLDDVASAALTVTYGQARISGIVDGDASLVSHHGGVQVHDVRGTATLTSKHGDVRADELGGDADLTNAHGAVDVDVVRADARVRTTYGNVRLGHVSRGKVSATSTHGRLEIGVAPTSAAWLDLDTGGRISNDLTSRDDPSGFDETVTVLARSHEGHIVVRRA